MTLAIVILILALLLPVAKCAGQVVIWQESFDGYADGSTSGDNNNTANPALDWFTNECGACIDTADWWEIRNGHMEARDVNQLVFMQSESIDISRFSEIEFSINIKETGDHEGLYFGLDHCPDQEKEDFVNVLYRLDNQSWNLISNFMGWCGLYETCGTHTLYGDDGINSGDCRDHDGDWGTAKVTRSNLSGNILELRIELINSSTTEIIQLDNIIVTGRLKLPVALRYIHATVLGNKVLLTWETASEYNNDYFQVERSISGSDWEVVGVLNGAGNSTEPLTYRFEDSQPASNRSFYRLRQVDFEGVFTFSEILSAEVYPLTTPYPNPTSGYLLIPWDQSSTEPILVRLMDVNGRELCVPYHNEQALIRLDLSTINPGQYLLWYFIENKWVKRRILVIN